MISAVAQQFYEALVEIATLRQRVFLDYNELPRFIGAEKCIEELVSEKLVVRYTTSIAVQLHPIGPIKSDRVCTLVQEVVKKYGLL